MLWRFEQPSTRPCSSDALSPREHCGPRDNVSCPVFSAPAMLSYAPATRGSIDSQRPHMFVVILGTVLGLMHLYLWKRLVKDTSGGRTRWALSGVLLALMVLLFATLLLPRLLGFKGPAWLAWPGYIWFGLVVYLFLTLLVLEPVRLALLP